MDGRRAKGRRLVWKPAWPEAQGGREEKAMGQRAGALQEPWEEGVARTGFSFVEGVPASPPLPAWLWLLAKPELQVQG